MNKVLQKLNLSDGLIAIGANKKAGKTSFSILLANELAKTEHVLFLNWTDYYEKLEDIINKTFVPFSKNLKINTNVGYFDVGSFLKIIDLIESYNYSTIFIDDVNYFTRGDITCFIGREIRNEAIRALKFITEKYKVRVIFTISIDAEIRNSQLKPDLGDFAWSRLIINDCDQVFALHNLYNLGNTTLNTLHTYNDIEVFNLKNDSLTVESYTFSLT